VFDDGVDTDVLALPRGPVLDLDLAIT
jgi:hypothetical protein